jgi:hypothetical protein
MRSLGVIARFRNLVRPVDDLGMGCELRFQPTSLATSTIAEVICALTATPSSEGQKRRYLQKDITGVHGSYL